jgi:hypothetical protein
MCNHTSTSPPQLRGARPGTDGLQLQLLPLLDRGEDVIMLPEPEATPSVLTAPIRAAQPPGPEVERHLHRLSTFLLTACLWRAISG